MATGKEILNDAKQKMAKSGYALQRTLADIRAGQANASLLNSVKVEYYGAPTPLNQVASITIPEARQLLITPYDESVLEEIEKAIYASNLGLTPQNDGSSIRLIIPQLTEDRRKELVKDVKAELEKTNDVAAAAYLGTVIAKKALEAGITTVVYDRGGFIYQGKIQALADAAREAGLKF